MALNFLTKKPVVIFSALGTITGGIIIIKSYFVTERYMSNEKLQGKRVIVTGASTGIGREIVRDLMHRDAEVIMACRNLDKCRAARIKLVSEYPQSRDRVTCQQLDLASVKSVRNFATDILEKHKKVDILVNNAGVMGFPYTLTEDGFETHLAVNHLGPFLLTKLLAPHVNDKIITLTCAGHQAAKVDFENLNSQTGYDPENAFRQSKLALLYCLAHLAAGDALAAENQAKILAVAPGMVNTDITKHVMEKKWRIARPFYRLVCYLLFQSPMQGAQSVMRACLDPDLANGTYLEGNEASKLTDKLPADNIAKQMWLTSDKWTTSRL